MKLPPMDPWAPGVCGVDVPIVDNGDPPFDFAELPEPEFNIEDIDMPEPGETNSFEDHVNGVEQPLPAPGAAMVEFALDYARRGWPVFPCRPANKAPFFEGGFHVATTCGETIRKWWGYWPKAMIGVPMGSRSGVWAVDPDPPKKPEEPDGCAIWASLVKEHGKLPATHTEVTPRGGQHILFKWDPNRPVTNSPGALVKTNIDVRGEGGYIVVAPSVCIGDGTPKNVAGQYCVAEPLDFFHFAEAPDWLYELVLASPQPEPKSRPKLTMVDASILSSGKSRDDGKQFWRKINDMAFGNLSAWVPDVFGCAAIYQPATGAWRISSKDLGRDLEEDLSISPQGGKDWGVWDQGDPRSGRRSAISVVIEYGRAKDARTAAMYLCERCGVDPVSLGWRARRSTRGVSASSVIREAEELDNGTVTQDGVAQVFARRFEDRLRYCHHTGAWFEWTGTYWKRDETALAFQFCRELAREFTEEAGISELKEVRKISFAGGVEKFAKSDRAMAVTSEIWDSDPFLLGTPDGTVDLRTGKLREPEPADGITKITAVSPAETADCPRWLQFLEETFGDAELIRFIQQWSGYCLTGDISEHALVFGFGNGGNGKGGLAEHGRRHHGRLRHNGGHGDVHRIEVRPASDGTGHAARRAAGDGERDRGRPLMGRKPDQADDGRRSHHRAVHAEGLLHLPAELQADHHRQSQAVAAECGRSRSPALQSHSLQSRAGQCRQATAGKAPGGMARHPALDDRWLPRLAGKRPGAARERRPGDRKLFRGSGPAVAMARGGMRRRTR